MYDLFKWTKASSRRNRLTAEYEPLQPFFLFALGEDAGCRTFIDVGANIGAYSLFATLIPTIEQVVAFEADPKTRSEIDLNVSLNGLGSTIEVRGEAVSNAIGQVTFGTVGELSGANSVVETSIHEQSAFLNRFTVETTTLDHFFKAKGSEPLLMKIDVEGHESAVLEGGATLLQTRQSLLQVECYGASGVQTARRLVELGYRRLTAIGPDTYFTNVSHYDDPAKVVSIYERASQQLIDHFHRDKPLLIERGDFALKIFGNTADRARRLKRQVLGPR